VKEHSLGSTLSHGLADRVPVGMRTVMQITNFDKTTNSVLERLMELGYVAE
jgi:hypothetical protein